MQQYLQEIQQFDTPFYFYDLDLLQQTLQACKNEANKYGYKIHYALKANSNPVIVKEIAKNGFGADCVSGNEVSHAANCGFPDGHIVFAGVGKTDKEINTALDLNIARFNVESVPELEVINALAAKKQMVATVNIRVNPNVKSYTHANITTGLNENKFGVAVDDLKDIISLSKTLKNIQLGGLHFHIGSQITKMEAFKNLAIRVNQINAFCYDLGWQVDVLNVGGGLGIDYVNPKANPIPNFKEYFAAIHNLLEPKPHQEIHFELGRSLVGQMGKLMSRVLYVKEGKSKNFLILDAGMTELMRPALYQASHFIENVSNTNETEKCEYDVVGPICESTDCFGRELLLPKSVRNDLIAIHSAGAYGESMANNYNLKKLERSYYIEQGKIKS